jgi:hypothetical protein
MKIIYSNLSSGHNRAATSTLKLLTSLVLSTPANAREVFHHFNFQFKPLETLLTSSADPKTSSNRRGGANKSGGGGGGEKEMTDDHDVRSSYILFLLAFLKSGDPTLIHEILTMKTGCSLSAAFRAISSDPFPVSNSPFFSSTSVLCLFLPSEEYHSFFFC